jgi:DNA-binding response OmpR family regulator
MISMNRPTTSLLIVDPCRDTRALVLERAGPKGLSVITANDPDVARTTLEMMVPDVVLTDLFAADQAGIRLIREIRARYPRCSIILMAEKGHDSAVLEALRAGAVDYLLKPIIGTQVCESLDRAVHAIRRTADDVPGLERLEYRLTIGNDLRCVESAVSWLIQATGELLPGLKRQHVQATLIELVLNAIEHGSLEICYRDKRDALAADRYDILVASRRRDPRFSERKVTACVRYDKQAHQLRYSVSDEGKGFSWRHVLNRAEEACRSDAANGRGLVLAQAFFPSLTYNETGTEVSFTVPVL